MQGQKITNCKFCRNEHFKFFVIIRLQGSIFFTWVSDNGPSVLSCRIEMSLFSNSAPARQCSSKNIYAFVCLLVCFFGVSVIFMFFFLYVWLCTWSLACFVFLLLCFSLLAFCLFDLCCFALLLFTSLCFVLAWLYFVLVCLLARWLVCFFACLFAGLLVCLFACALASLFVCLFVRLFSCLPVCFFVGLLVCWLVGWLVGWWLVG